MGIRTDMAIEAKRLWDKSMEEKTQLQGVKARNTAHFDIPIDVVEILDKEGSQALGKPEGTYVTVDLGKFCNRERGYFRRTAEALARVLRTMLPPTKNVLVACLGNANITADAVGPETMDNLVVTRHLTMRDIPVFREFATVSAIGPSVLGKTGIESAELVMSAVEKIRPDCVLAVDALASCEPERLCMSVQIADTGITPGSGVGNHRASFTKESLGVPVYAIGVPTVVDGATFLAVNGQGNAEKPRDDLVLTARDIDIRVREIGKLIGYGINLALQPPLDFDDIPGFLP